MLVDLTLKVTPKMVTDAQGTERKAFTGHLGTHFDVMDKEFPLEYTERKGLVFDVSSVRDRDIGTADVDLEKVMPGMFVAFCTGFIEEAGYGTAEYAHSHPQLSGGLIDALLDRGVSVIGIDAAGVRRGKEHTPTDQRCADRGVFIVENLCNLKCVDGECVIRTFPMNFAGMSGLPCRVVAELK